MLRLGQPDMLGDGDTGPRARRPLELADPGRRRARRGGWRAVREPRPALRGRRRGRVRPQVRRVDGAGGGRRLPRLRRGDGRDVAVRPRPEGPRPSTTASSAASSSGSPRPCSGSASTGSGCRRTSRSSAAGASCRSSPPCAALGARACCCRSPTRPSTPASPSLGAWLVGNSILGRRPLRRRQPAAGPARAAPPAQLGARGSPVGSYQTAGGGDRARGHRAVPVRATRPPAAFMTGLLPDHDVRAAGRGAGDLPGGHARPPQGGRRRDAVRRAHVVPDRGDRAARVRVHVRGVAALPHPRRADRDVDGAGQRARASRTASGSRRARSTTS